MALDLSTLTVSDGDATVFATAGRPKSDIAEQYRPFVIESWHNRGADGKGAPKHIAPIPFGMIDEATKGLRAAGRLVGCSVLVRWAPSDAKRHEAIVAARNAAVTDSPEWVKLGDKLSASPGVLHYRGVPTITRPRTSGEASGEVTV